MVLIIILLIFAAIFKAISDTLAHHFSTSVFKNCSHSFFDPSVSWLNKYIGHDVSKGINHADFQPFSDAWHLSNSLLICCFVAMPFIPHANLHGLIGYAAAGLINVCTFNLFYTHLLKSK